jgi:serine phosphatase RsbU (regulator of sigma subunit)
MRGAQHDRRQSEERADQDEEDDPEAEARALRFASTFEPGAPARALPPVAAGDRRRIDGRLFGGADAAGWLGHRESLGGGRLPFHRSGSRSTPRRHTESVGGALRRGNVALHEGDALRALAAAVDPERTGDSLAGTLGAIVDALLAATGAQLAVVRTLDPVIGGLAATAVASTSTSARAELEGSRLEVDELPADEVHELDGVPDPVRRAAARAGADQVVLVPISGPGGPRGTVEVLRAGAPFGDAERALVRFAAAQVGLALRAYAGGDTSAAETNGVEALTLVGDALAAGVETAATGEQIARIAAEATHARATLLWHSEGDSPVLSSSFGADGPHEALAAAAQRSLSEPAPVVLEAVELPEGPVIAASLQLGHPPAGVLQLLFDPEEAPRDELLTRLATFGVRAAHALRASARTRTVAQELERTRALLAVVGQAIAQLSLVHTLETAVERVADLLGADAVAVYLREDGRLITAAERGLAGPHVRLAERLLELVLGGFRARGMLYVEDAGGDPRLSGLHEAAAESGIEAAFVAPLLVREDAIGLLALYPRAGRVLTENETALLLSLASQLAVAVQNAQLHERAKQLGTELEGALTAERQSARQLRALYEISRSFAQSLSLDHTLETLARTAVEVLDVDAAVVRMLDVRGDLLVPRALHVAEERLAEPVGAILTRPAPAVTTGGFKVHGLAAPVVLDAPTARELGPPHSLLVPFLEKGSTAAIVPIATPVETLASLTIVSLQPGRPITQERVELALSIGGQAALALDNARLYQQQKEFADTMQRSLLPRAAPQVAGLDVGAVYESSARVDVGGDVYDYVELGEGVLAVALGDVTGHGIEATADMAMAKFVFRSLARERGSPGEFLAAANQVVVDEIAPGKFITMSYVVVDANAGTVDCACAGHPAPRLVAADGTVRGLDARGLALGIEDDQRYSEVHAKLPVGAAVVLYTDGVIEARHDGELYGLERLDKLLAGRRDLGAEQLAEAAVADCRRFAGGELADDAACVVIKRSG